MKTCSRFIFAPLILAALLLAMAVSAQETSAKQPATTTQQPSTVLETRATTKATPTQTANLRIKLPSKIPTKAPLPDVFRDPQRPKQDYPRMPNLIGLDILEAERRLFSVTREIKPRIVPSKAHNPNYRPGTVLAQFPTEGAELRPGVEVVLNYNPNPRPPVYPRMPNLIGMNISEAEGRLFSVTREIKPRRTESKGYNPNYRPGTVVDQFPTESAELRPGVEVILYYNPKPQPPVYPRMPNLIGLDGKEAGRKLSNDAPGVQWNPQPADTHVSKYPVGAVVSQSPVAGTELRPGISVVLSLNPKPPPPVYPRMPNVVGLNDKSATKTLQQEAPNIPYRYEMAPSNNPNYVEGVVVSQFPAAGTELRQGIKIVLSLNPHPTPTPTVTPTPTPTVTPTPVVVPDVRKKELIEAIGLLRAAQLNVGDVTKKDPNETANSVLEQQPLPGQQVAVASRINLVIGKQSETGGLIKAPLNILGVIALGFFALLLGRLWRRFRSKPGEARANFNTHKIPPHDEPPPPAPTLRFHSIMNASSSEFAASTELQTSFALRFQPKADWGQQHITHTGGLIAAESEEL
jgi:beta-lactam-binding protein with PASTA domain